MTQLCRLRVVHGMSLIEGQPVKKRITARVTAEGRHPTAAAKTPTVCGHAATWRKTACFQEESSKARNGKSATTCRATQPSWADERYSTEIFQA
jgi:hypothetical protein